MNKVTKDTPHDPVNNKHTPGPWRVKQMPNDLICILPDSNLAVADCCDMADARLIAAAPELLAALRALVDAESLPEANRWEVLNEAREAISKATGGAVTGERA